MILVAGYAYIRENFLNTFRESMEQGDMSFVLPKRWEAKGGKVVFSAPKRKGVIATPAFFSHSHYPLIGGLLKGWMPLLPLILWRMRKNVSVLYSPSEPVLLSTLYQGLWAKVFGIKHVIFTWENIAYREKFSGIRLRMKEILIRWNCALAGGIVCGNHKAQDIIRQYTSKPTAVIPLSGVDTEFFSPEKKDLSLKQEHGLDGKFIFSFIGALGFRKGVHLILEALSYMDNVSHLVIAGSGEYESELKNQIASLGLKDRVTMIPWVDPEKVRDILSVTDVFLYPSLPYAGWEEQFGYSIAEAMAMGVAVISTRSGSITDLIEHSKTGILIEPNDAKALEQAMRLLGDESRREPLARAGRSFIAERYAYSAVALAYRQFFSRYGRRT